MTAGDYAYAGFGITQEEFDPLKDYYEDDPPWRGRGTGNRQGKRR